MRPPSFQSEPRPGVSVDWSDRVVLVTGAGGFIGSQLAEELARRGASVRALVHYNSQGSRGWLDQCPPDLQAKITVIAGDVRDAAAVRSYVGEAEVVFHLAALIAIPYSYHAPQSYLDTNVSGTLHLLSAVRESGARLVQTSTSEVYGSAQTLPIREDHPLHPQSPYAATKVAADQLALSFHRSFGTKVTVLRPFNTYGPRQSTRAVLPTIITQVLSGAQTIRLGATSPTRDWNHVSDTVRAFLLAGSEPAALGQVIHTGTGFEISVGDAARLIAEIAGRHVEIVSDDERLRPKDSEVERLVADPGRATALLGWTPLYSGAHGLRKGLEETLGWYREPLNLRMFRSGTYSL